jgi:predicted RNA-binding Zn-ribbon protein involved in translation (DUF1610 family)
MTDFCPFCEKEVELIITRDKSIFADVGETDVYTCPKCGEAFESVDWSSSLKAHYNDRTRKWEAKND